MPKPTLKIGYMPITDHLILGISHEHDNLRFEHLNLQPTKFHSWQDLCNALENKKLDGAFILTPLSFKLKSEGVNIKLVCLGNREGSVLVVRNNINSVKDLKNKLIAIPHKLSTHTLLLHKLVTEAGLKYKKDIDTVEMDPSDMINELSRGKIDGYIVAEPFGSQAEEQKIGKILISTQKIKKHHICCALAIRGEILKRYSKSIQELVNSLVKAGEYIHKSPKEASEIGSKFLGQAQSTVFSALTSHGGRVISWDLLPIKDDFKEMQDYSMNKIELPLKKINMDEFIETSYAEKAYEYLILLSGKKEKKRLIIEKAILPILIFVLFLAIWHLLATSGLFLKSLLPAPIDVIKATGEIYSSGVLLNNLLASLFRVFTGFVMAAIFAIPVGFAVGLYRRAEYAFDPLIQVVRTISPIAWIPLAILWFGIGNKPAIFIIFITSIFPILIATMHAVKNIDPVIIKSAVNFGAKNLSMLRKVIFPASFPYIVIGLRIALGIAWVIVVAAEMVGMQSGLGFMILDARNFLRIDMVIAGMLIIGLMGFALDKLMNMIEKKVGKNMVNLDKVLV